MSLYLIWRSNVNDLIGHFAFENSIFLKKIKMNSPLFDHFSVSIVAVVVVDQELSDQHVDAEVDLLHG